MAMTKKQINDALRQEYVEKIIEALSAAGEEVLRVGSNVIAIPVVDAAGEDSYVRPPFTRMKKFGRFLAGYGRKL